jgi:predicted RNase H-like nuclease (RuvC/YqgF family)
MTWSDVIKWAVYILIPVIFSGGVIKTFLELRANKRAVEALSTKDEAVADATKSASSIELAKLWMESNQKLVESNGRLERSNEKLQKSNDRLQREVDQIRGAMHSEVGQARREMNDIRDVMRSLVSVVERFMPLFQKTVETEGELALLTEALAKAKALNGGAA